MKLEFTRFTDLVKKHSPEVFVATSIIGTIGQMVMVAKQPKTYLLLYKNTGNEQYLEKYYRLTKSNNWLKIHGYTIRRKH